MSGIDDEGLALLLLQLRSVSLSMQPTPGPSDCTQSLDCDDALFRPRLDRAPFVAVPAIARPQRPLESPAPLCLVSFVPVWLLYRPPARILTLSLPPSVCRARYRWLRPLALETLASALVLAWHTSPLRVSAVPQAS